MRLLATLMMAVLGAGCGEGILVGGGPEAARQVAGEGPGPLFPDKKWGNWTNCSSNKDCYSGLCGCFNSSQKKCLPNSQYLTPCLESPGPAGSTCGSDAECQSKWCGCQGGSIKVCLPNSSYSKACSNQKATGSTCESDAECQSEWCGCQGGSIKVCLPNSSYSKACSSPSPPPPPPSTICPPAGSSTLSPPTLGDLSGQVCDYSCWGSGTIYNVCASGKWQFCLPKGKFAACTQKSSSQPPAQPPASPPPPAPSGCPCFPAGSGKNNFCHHGPGTAGCSMTFAGGYCDPNGDKSFDDADWSKGWSEYVSKCGG